MTNCLIMPNKPEGFQNVKCKFTAATKFIIWSGVEELKLSSKKFKSILI